VNPKRLPDSAGEQVPSPTYKSFTASNELFGTPRATLYVRFHSLCLFLLLEVS